MDGRAADRDAAKHARPGVAVRLKHDLHGELVATRREPDAGRVLVPRPNAGASDPLAVQAPSNR